ncbi:MAG: hypothetical protein AAFN93_30285, partial [Bacteroidota bacterium]
DIKKQIRTSELFVKHAFTQKTAFEEFVRAAEGVLRDGINVINNSALRSGDKKISVKDIRTAARKWFQRDKERAIQTRDNAKIFLRWIIDEVIGKRNARAFLVPSDEKYELIEYLYDSRILHIIKQGISADLRAELLITFIPSLSTPSAALTNSSNAVF